jgi:hypothetical protein
MSQSMWTTLALEIATKYPRRRRDMLVKLELLRQEYRGSEDIGIEFLVRRKLGLMNNERGG